MRVNCIWIGMFRKASKDSDQPVHMRRLIIIFAVRLRSLWIFGYPRVPSEDWSDYADAQADLGLRSAHMQSRKCWDPALLFQTIRQLWYSIKGFKYSWLSLPRPRLSRMTAYLEVKIWSLPKHENLTTGKKYCEKEENLLLRSHFSSFPQYLQYISKFKSPITYIFVKSDCANYFFLNSANLICRVTDISKYFRESLKFEITRVDCI